MEHKQAALDLADFLDSPEAARVATVRRADLRRIAEAFLAACYDDLGKKPNLLDGQDVQVVLEQLLPGRLAPKDPAVEHVPDVLAAFVDHLEATRVVSQAFEIRRALGEGLPAFVERVRSGRNAGQQVAAPAKPVVYGAPKLGRNDPCSCGSGKKYKKCHGANA